MLKKWEKLRRVCTRLQQLQLYSHTFGRQCKCCQINVVALDTGVGTYSLFMFRLIQTPAQWASDKLCVISIFHSSTSPAPVSDIGCAAALSCCSLPVRLSQLAWVWFVNSCYYWIFFAGISQLVFNQYIVQQCHSYSSISKHRYLIHIHKAH